MAIATDVSISTKMDALRNARIAALRSQATLDVKMLKRKLEIRHD